jgi:hypothetical protein
MFSLHETESKEPKEPFIRRLLYFEIPNELYAELQRKARAQRLLRRNERLLEQPNKLRAERSKP